MKLIFGADHRGYQLKESLKKFYPYAIDAGAAQYDQSDDYVVYANAAVNQMQPEDKVILLCGSGHGMDIAANRYPQVRAILGFNQSVVKQGREHEDANVLIIPADWVSEAEAQQMVVAFLNTPFSNEERHRRRIEKI